MLGQDPPAEPCLGVFDSGLGGLSVLRAIRRLAPDLPLAYVGDTARVPYGPRPASDIIRFNLEIAAFLARQGATRLAVACNTSCALAMDTLQHRIPLPIHGLIDAGAQLAVGLAPAKASGGVGVLATEGTIRAGAYERSLKGLKPGLRVRSLSCPTWVPLVEAGLAGSPQADLAVAEALRPWQGDPPSIVILGCTHYPFLAPAIARALGPAATLVDPAEAMAEEIVMAWGPTPPRRQADRHHATGDPLAFAQGAKALGVPLDRVHPLPLSNLSLPEPQPRPGLPA